MTAMNILDTCSWAEHYFGSLVTNRQCPRRDVMRAVRAGLMVSVGEVLLCDDDCHAVSPERYREGFRLTPAGRAKVEAWRA